MWWPAQLSGVGLPSLLFLIHFSALLSSSYGSDCVLVGKGACRGDGWTDGKWPENGGKQSLEGCCDLCAESEGCTGLSVSKTGDCLLYGHKKLVPASGLGGECYSVSSTKTKVSKDAPAAGKESPKAAKEEKKEKPAEVKSEETKSEEPKKASKSEESVKVDKKQVKPEENVNKKNADKDDDNDDDENDDDDDNNKKNVKKGKKSETKKPEEKQEKLVEKPTPKPSGNKPESKPVEKKAPPPPKPVESPKAKPTLKPAEKKPAKAAPISVGGKFVVTVGEGGCRGKEWRKAPWPVDAGRLNTEQCAKSCLEKSCTGFHILKEEDGTFECLLFGHNDVLAVKSLGGKCLKLSDTPLVESDADAEEDDEEELDVQGPVHMAHLGKGRCRGEGWTYKRWPTLKGYLTAKQCAEACARKKGCTAFDLSDEQPERKFECALYGHKKIQAAYGVPGNCYVLSDKPGVVPEDVGSAAVVQEEEVEEELPVKGEVEYHQLGKGRCRGPGWTFKKWPVIKGNISPKECAINCAKKKGCTSFDIGLVAEGQEECALYGHKDVTSAYGVPGDCYKLGKSDSPVEEEQEPEEEEVDDGVTHKYRHLGHGMCRGAHWQGKKWPVLRGIKSLQECANACGRKAGCTAFDTSRPEGNLFDCMLYGHKNPVPAPGVPGECYTLIGAKFIEEVIEATQPETRSRAKILDEDDQDFVNIKNVELLGKGACRGQGWQSGQWPVSQGRKTLKDCAESCKKTTGCVAFDLSNKESDKYDCLLLGHKDVLPASGLAAKCFIIQGAVPVESTLITHDAPKGAKKIIKDNYPGSGHGYEKLGSGLCRGTGWQSSGWPMDKGLKTIKECAESCTAQKGCKAFDLSSKDGSKFSCLLFNHKSISPASALDGACYVASNMDTQSEGVKDDVEEEEEEDVIIDLEGDVDVALLGKGGCRGGGWTENGWPKVKGFVSVDECGKLCVSTKGCTAFHIGYPKEGSKSAFECFLFGHKSVVPATGLIGNCYTVASGSSKVIKSKHTKEPTKPEKKKKQKKYKIPEFEEPKVIEDEFDDDDDEWLFEPPPAEIRSREHITQILGLDQPNNDAVLKVTEGTLKDLKKVYENSIKELEKAYKYKELSNRHFGDPEIFNKPLIVLMGPWSGGKSTIINYLLGTEYTKNAFRSSAEPSPGFNFNIAMYGDEEEEIDGTQMSAEWAFSSLQKFGQEFLKKLRGKKMPNKLLEKATFAEIPGVLETGTIRKIDRRYPFNDACQWFIDHADLIVLVYDYAKLDIGPETEALLDQLKGREQQVRILLNKADEITAEELLKIQGNLVWNVSPLMASAEPPTLYAGSFWSKPYKAGAPKRLLKAQEQSLLKDIKEAIDKRVENRISTARRFAVRVRNHAKMVDCYLTTFKNNKGYFGDKKKIAQDIIDNPSKYHIYEGLSTLTNISRYDLPDPDTYRDFFNVHPLFDFETLQSTCTFFKGCPLNKLDIAIAYDLPDILTSYKKKVHLALNPPQVTIKETKQKSSKK